MEIFYRFNNNNTYIIFWNNFIQNLENISIKNLLSFIFLEFKVGLKNYLRKLEFNETKIGFGNEKNPYFE